MKRRKFLQLVVPATVLPGILKPFHVLAENNMLFDSLLRSVDDDKVLVVIYMNGGNDGLNTVIPLDQYGNLTSARSNILINAGQVLKLDGVTETGLHPSMTGMQSMFNNKKLQIIQSVGYPSPNFSHFRSTDIWTSASDSSQVIDTGWMGRFLDNQYPGFPANYPNSSMPDPLSIQIGASLPLIFQSNSANLSMVVSSPSIFNNTSTNQLDPAPNTPAGDELAYLRLIASQTKSYAKAIQTAYGNVTTQYSGYPAQGVNYLADILKVVARLIKGGLKTKIYSVSIGGFDTHSAQSVSGATSTGTHANLLTMLSQAVSAFQADVEYLGIDKRVLGMTFSEFGRRIISNSSLGTDHGAAGPMFVFGTAVKGGILGTNPIIPSTVTSEDNIPMQYDFRSVYSTVLKDWFCLPQTDVDSVMLKNFTTLPIIKNPCGSTPDNIKSIDELIQFKAYPNPFTDKLTIDVSGIEGKINLSLFDAMGRQIAIIANEKNANAGDYRYVFNGEQLCSGNYYLRLENGPIQKTIHVVKVA
jgi:uncharacterized protein (DUF1501 family)